MLHALVCFALAVHPRVAAASSLGGCGERLVHDDPQAFGSARSGGDRAAQPTSATMSVATTREVERIGYTLCERLPARTWKHTSR
jgi:hypothetical protein